MQQLEQENRSLRLRLEDQNLALQETLHEELLVMYNRYDALAKENRRLSTRLTEAGLQGGTQTDRGMLVGTGSPTPDILAEQPHRILHQDSAEQDSSLEGFIDWKLQFEILRKENLSLRAELEAQGIAAVDLPPASPSRISQDHRHSLHQSIAVATVQPDGISSPSQMGRDAGSLSPCETVSKEYTVLKSQLEGLRSLVNSPDLQDHPPDEADKAEVTERIPSDVDHLQKDCDRLARENDELVASRDALVKENQELQENYHNLIEDLEDLKSHLGKSKDRSKKDYTKLKARVTVLVKENEALQRQVHQLGDRKSTAPEDEQQVSAQPSEEQQPVESNSQEQSSVALSLKDVAEFKELKSRYRTLEVEYERISIQARGYEALQQKYESLDQEHQRLTVDQQKLKKELSLLRKEGAETGTKGHPPSQKQKSQSSSKKKSQAAKVDGDHLKAELNTVREKWETTKQELAHTGEKLNRREEELRCSAEALHAAECRVRDLETVLQRIEAENAEVAQDHSVSGEYRKTGIEKVSNPGVASLGRESENNTPPELPDISSEPCGNIVLPSSSSSVHSKADGLGLVYGDSGETQCTETCKASVDKPVQMRDGEGSGSVCLSTELVKESQDKTVGLAPNSPVHMPDIKDHTRHTTHTQYSDSEQGHYAAGTPVKSGMANTLKTEDAGGSVFISELPEVDDPAGVVNVDGAISKHRAIPAQMPGTASLEAELHKVLVQKDQLQRLNNVLLQHLKQLGFNVRDLAKSSTQGQSSEVHTALYTPIRSPTQGEDLLVTQQQATSHRYLQDGDDTGQDPDLVDASLSQYNTASDSMLQDEDEHFSSFAEDEHYSSTAEGKIEEVPSPEIALLPGTITTSTPMKGHFEIGEESSAQTSSCTEAATAPEKDEKRPSGKHQPHTSQVKQKARLKSQDSSHSKPRRASATGLANVDKMHNVEHLAQSNEKLVVQNKLLMDKLHKQVADANSEFAKMRNKYVIAEKEKKDLQAQLSKGKRNTQAPTSRERKPIGTQPKDKDDLKKLKREKADLEKEISGLKQEVQQKCKENTELMAVISDQGIPATAQDIAHLHIQNEILMTEKNELCSKFETERSDLLESIEELQRKNKLLLQDMEGGDLPTSIVASGPASDENAQQPSDCSNVHVDGQVQELNFRIEDLTEKLRKVQRENADLEVQLAMLLEEKKQVCAHFQAECKEAQNQVKTLSAQKDSLQTEMEQCRADATSARSQYQSLLVEFEQLQSELDAVCAEKGEQENIPVTQFGSIPNQAAVMVTPGTQHTDGAAGYAADQRPLPGAGTAEDNLDNVVHWLNSQQHRPSAFQPVHTSQPPTDGAVRDVSLDTSFLQGLGYQDVILQYEILLQEKKEVCIQLETERNRCSELENNMGELSSANQNLKEEVQALMDNSDSFWMQQEITMSEKRELCASIEAEKMKNEALESDIQALHSNEESLTKAKSETEFLLQNKEEECKTLCEELDSLRTKQHEATKEYEKSLNECTEVRSSLTKENQELRDQYRKLQDRCSTLESVIDDEGSSAIATTLSAKETELCQLKEKIFSLQQENMRISEELAEKIMSTKDPCTAEHKKPGQKKPAEKETVPKQEAQPSIQQKKINPTKAVPAKSTNKNEKSGHRKRKPAAKSKTQNLKDNATHAETSSVQTVETNGESEQGKLKVRDANEERIFELLVEREKLRQDIEVLEAEKKQLVHRLDEVDESKMKAIIVDLNKQVDVQRDELDDLRFKYDEVVSGQEQQEHHGPVDRASPGKDHTVTDYSVVPKKDDLAESDGTHFQDSQDILSELELVKAKCTVLEQQIEQLEKNSSHATEHISHLETEVEGYSESILDKDRIIRVLQEDVNNLATEKANAEVEQVDLKKEIKTLQEAIQDTEDETTSKMNTLLRENNEVNEKLAMKDVTLAALQSELVSKDNELRSSLSQLEYIEKEIDMLRKENGDLHDALEDCHNSRGGLKEEIKRMQGEMERQREQFREELAEQEQKMREAEKERTNLTEKEEKQCENTRHLQAELNASMARLEDIQTSNASLQGENKELTEKVSLLIDEKESLRCHVDVLENQKQTEENKSCLLTEQLEQWAAQKEKVENDLAQALEELKVVKDNLVDSEEAVNKAKTAKNLVENKAQMSEEQLAKAEAEITVLKKMVESLECSNAASTISAENLKVELERSTTEKDELLSRIAQQESELANEAKSHQKEVHELEEKTGSLENDLAAISHTQHNMQIEISELNEERASLKASLEVALADLNENVQAAADATTKADILEVRFGEAHKKLEDWELREAQWKKKEEDFELAKGDQQEKLKAFDEEVELLKKHLQLSFEDINKEKVHVEEKEDRIRELEQQLQWSQLQLVQELEAHQTEAWVLTEAKQREASLADTVKSLQDSLEGLERKVTETLSSKDAADQDVRNLRCVLAEKETECNILKEQVQKQCEDLETAEQNIVKLERQKDLSEAHTEDVVRSLTRKAEDLKRANSSLEQELGHFKEAHTKNDEEIKSLKADILLKNDENKTLRVDLLQFEEELTCARSTDVKSKEQVQNELLKQQMLIQELNATVERLTKDLENTQELHKDAELKVADVQSDLQTSQKALEMHAQTHEHEMEALKKQLTEKNLEVDTIHHDCEVQREKNLLLENNLGRLRTELQECSASYDVLKQKSSEEKDELLDVVQRLTNSVAKHKAKETELTSRNDDLVTSLEVLKESMEGEEESCRQLVCSLQQDNAYVTNCLQEERSKVKMLMEDVSTSKVKTADLETEYAESEKNVEELQKECSSLRLKITDLDNKHTQAMSRLSVVEEKWATLCQENDDLRDKLEHVGEQLSEVSSEKERTEMDLVDMRNEVDKVKGVASITKTELEKMEVEHKMVLDSREHLQDEHNMLSQQLERIKEEQEDRGQQKLVLDTRCAELEDLSRVLEQKCDILEEQLKASSEEKKVLLQAVQSGESKLHDSTRAQTLLEQQVSNYEHQFTTSQSELQHVKSDLENALLKSNESISALQEKENTVQKLLKKNMTLKDTANTLQEKVSSLESNVDSCNSQISTLERDLHESHTQLDKGHKVWDKTEQELFVAKQQLVQTEENMGQLKKEQSILEQKAFDAMLEKATLEKELDRTTKELMELRSKVIDLEVTNRTLSSLQKDSAIWQEEQKNSLHENSTLKARLEVLEEELKSIAGAKKDKDHENAELQQKIRLLEEKHNEHTKLVDSMNVAETKNQNQIGLLEKTVEQIQEKLSSTTVSYDLLKEESTACQKDLEKRLENALLDLEGAEKERSNLMANNTNLQQEQLDKCLQIESLKTHVSDMKERNSEIERDLHEKLNDLVKGKAELEKENKEIQNAASTWKARCELLEKSLNENRMSSSSEAENLQCRVIQLEADKLCLSKEHSLWQESKATMEQQYEQAKVRLQQLEYAKQDLEKQLADCKSTLSDTLGKDSELKTAHTRLTLEHEQLQRQMQDHQKHLEEEKSHWLSIKEDWQREKNMMAVDIQSLRAECDKLCKAKKSLEENFRTVERDLQNRQVELETKMQERQELIEQLQNQRIQNEDLFKTCEKTLLEVKDLDQINKNLLEEIQLLNNKFETASRGQEEVTLTTQSLEDELQSLKQQLIQEEQEAQQTAIEWEDKYKSIELERQLEIASLQSMNESTKEYLTGKCTSLEEDLSQAVSDKEILNKRLQEAILEQHQTDGKYREAQEKMAEIQKELDNIQVNQEKELLSLKETAGETNAKLLCTEKELDALVSALHSVEMELLRCMESESRDVDEFKEHTDADGAKEAEEPGMPKPLQDMKANLLKSLGVLQSDMQHLRQENSKLSKDLGEMGDQVTHTSKVVEDLQNELRDTKQVCSEQQKKIEDNISMLGLKESNQEMLLKQCGDRERENTSLLLENGKLESANATLKESFSDLCKQVSKLELQLSEKEASEMLLQKALETKAAELQQNQFSASTNSKGIQVSLTVDPEQPSNTHDSSVVEERTEKSSSSAECSLAERQEDKDESSKETTQICGMPTELSECQKRITELTSMLSDVQAKYEHYRKQVAAVMSDTTNLSPEEEHDIVEPILECSSIRNLENPPSVAVHPDTGEEVKPGEDAHQSTFVLSSNPQPETSTNVEYLKQRCNLLEREYKNLLEKYDHIQLEHSECTSKVEKTEHGGELEDKIHDISSSSIEVALITGTAAAIPQSSPEVSMHELQEENARLYNTKTDLENDVMAAQADVKEMEQKLHDANVAMDLERNTFKAKMDDFQKLLGTVTSAKEQVEQELKQQREEFEKNLARARSQALMKLVQSEVDRDDIVEQMTAAEKQVSTLRDELRKEKEEKELLKLKIVHLMRECKLYERHISDLEKQVDIQRSQIEEAMEEHKETIRLLAEMRLEQEMGRQEQKGDLSRLEGELLRLESQFGSARSTPLTMSLVSAPDSVQKGRLESSVVSDHGSRLGFVDESKVGSDLPAGDDGHKALEMKHFEMVEQITVLQRELLAVKNMKEKSVRENRELREALVKERTVRAQKRRAASLGSLGAIPDEDSAPSQTIYQEPPRLTSPYAGSVSSYGDQSSVMEFSNEVISLKEKVILLEEVNQELREEKAALQERLRKQEDLVKELRKFLKKASTEGSGTVSTSAETDVTGQQITLLQGQRDALSKRLEETKEKDTRIVQLTEEKYRLEEELRVEKENYRKKAQEKEMLEVKLLQERISVEKQMREYQELQDMVRQKEWMDQQVAATKAAEGPGEKETTASSQKSVTKQEVLEEKSERLVYEIRRRITCRDVKIQVGDTFIPKEYKRRERLREVGKKRDQPKQIRLNCGCSAEVGTSMKMHTQCRYHTAVEKLRRDLKKQYPSRRSSSGRQPGTSSTRVTPSRPLSAGGVPGSGTSDQAGGRSQSVGGVPVARLYQTSSSRSFSSGSSGRTYSRTGSSYSSTGPKESNV